MKKALMVLLLAFSASLSTAPATVLVYRGSGTHFVGTAPNFSRTERAFLIVDLASQEMTLIYYGIRDQKHAQVMYVDQKTLDTTLVTRPPKNTYEIFCSVSRQNPGAFLFGDEAAIFRGVIATLNVSGSPNAYTTEMHPRTLSGTYRYIGQGIGTTYDEHATSLVFDQAATLFANNGNQTIAQVQTDIVTSLITAGYPP